MQLNPHFNKKSSLPNYIYNAPWDVKQKKISRFITIVNLYKEIFGRKSIPEDGQYWAMCGSHFNKDKPIKGELGYITEKGLIRPDQYFGVDREEIIIEENKRFFPNINWIHGDFVEELEKVVIYNPKISIINYDGVMQPKNSVQYLKKIMSLIDYNIGNELMLISNFILVNPYSKSERLKYSIFDVLKELKKLYWIPDHWYLYPESYQYSHSQAVMGIIIFIKEEHDIKNIKYSPNKKIGYVEE